MQSSERSHASRRAILALSIASLLAGPTAPAATFTWVGPADEAWDTTSNNWDPVATLPWDSTNGFSNLAVFNTPALAAVVNGTVFANGITFDAAGSLSDGIITLGGTAPLITVGDGVTANIGSVIDGTAGLTKIGTGTLVLSGVNTFSGTLNVAAGTLRATTDVSALGTGTLSLVGGVLELANDTGLNFGRNTTVAANSTITSDTFFPGFAGVTHTLGTLSIGAQTLTISRGANATSGTGGITFGATTLTGNASFDVQSNARLTLGAIAGAANGFTKNGAGTLVLSGNNTYTGMTTVLSGALQVNNASALKSGNAITLGSSGSIDPTLVLNIGSDMTLGAITVPSNVVGATISMPDNTATKTYTVGGATLSSPLNVNQSNATSPRWSQITWSSKITGNGGGSGNDTLVFNNTSGMQNYYTTNSGVLHDFSGNVRLKAGVIAVQSGDAGANLCIPDASMLTLDAGEWRWNSGSMVETIDGLAGAGAIGNPQNSTLTINANNADNHGTAESPKRSFSGTLGNMKAGGALTLGGAGIQEFVGNKVTYNNNTNLNNGTLRLTKTTAWNSNIVLGGTSPTAPKLQLNAPLADDSWSFGKQISGSNSSAIIEKTGLGTVTLTSAQSGFNGSITVSNGKLMLASNPLPISMPSITGMTVWLDAADPDGNSIADTTNGTSISSWVNKAAGSPVGNFNLDGANGNAPTFNAASTAFNNQSAITFDDAGKQLVTPYVFGNTVSVVYVGRIDATKQRLVAGYPGSNWILGYWNGNMGANYWNGGNLGSAADTNAHIWMSGATNGAYAGYRFDGAGESSIGTGNGSGPNGLMLGGGWTNGTERSDGEIGELFVFDKQLSTTERQHLEGYLYNKYFGAQAGMVSLAATSTVTVTAGATFGGNGIAGNITVSNGGNLEGGNAGVGTLTAGNVTLGAIASDSVTLSGTLSTTAGYKPIAVTNLTINGGNQSVILNASGLGLTSGTYYDLLVSANPITAPNADSVLAALKSNARAYTPHLSGNTIQLYYDANASVYWTGTEGSTWDYGATNWKLKGNNGDTQFLTNDVVEFRDNPDSSTVDISNGDVNPAVVTFTNTTQTDYTLQGTNGIATGTITKSGNGTLAITNTNSTTGAVTLAGGLVTMSLAGGLGTGLLTMNGGSLQYTGTDNGTWTRSVTVGSGGGTLDVQDPAATLSTSGALGGNGSLKKTGPGMLAFSGAGTYAGNLIVSGGVLLANQASALGTGATAVVLGDANTGANPVEFRVGNPVTSAVTLASISNSNFGSSQTVTINAGSGLSVNAAGLITTVNLDGSVPITLKATNTNGHATAQDVNWRVLGSGIPAGQTALILDGTSWPLRFSQLSNTSAASNFTGDVLILGTVTTQGRTYLAAEAGNQNLNFLNNDVTVSGGATWSVVWGGETIGALNGSGTVNLNCQNALNNVGLTIGNNNRNGSFSGQIANNWGIAKTGTGTQTLSGAGITYTGATTVNGGRLALQDAYLFASPSAVISAGTLELNFGMEFDWFLPTAFSGVGNLEKTGTGKVVLTGISTGFTGPTKVDAGTLFVTGNLSGSAITVNNGTLGGSGTVGSVTVSAGGSLNPGDGVGILQSGNLTLAGTFGVEISGTSAGLTYDQLNVAGTVTLANATLSLTLNSFVPEHASLYFLVSNDGGDAINGTFGGLNDGAIVDLGGYRWEISYDANFQNGIGDSFSGGNDIALMAVPEPSAALLGGLGIVAMAIRRRRTSSAK